MRALGRAEAERLGWLGLAGVSGLGPGRARALAERVGGPQALLSLKPSVLASLGLKPDVVDGFATARQRAAAEADRVAAAGGSVIAWSDPDYPSRLRQVDDAPLVLSVLGALTDDQVAVAIVGSRRATPYGKRVAAELAEGLAAVGVAVVSGLAVGVDAAAHRGALSAGGTTIAVMATGIDQVYPPAHRGLADEIAATGALVTEFACGVEPLPNHFPRRNRIISGLSLGTIVVEAAERSGSLITARCAAEQGREVFAVPGPLGVAGHAGPHRLIQQGAKLVTGVADILDEIAPQLRPRMVERKQAAALLDLSTAEQAVLAALGDDIRPVDDVIRSAGTSPSHALETLLALELRGVVEQQPGMRFRRKAA